MSSSLSVPKDELARLMVNYLHGPMSLAASNPTKTINNHKTVMMRGLQPNASEEERRLAAETGDWIVLKGTQLSSPEIGRELLRLILKWE